MAAKEVYTHEQLPELLVVFCAFPFDLKLSGTVLCSRQFPVKVCKMNYVIYMYALAPIPIHTYQQKYLLWHGFV